LIGQRVRSLREQRGWSRAELAERSGVSDRLIRYYESGERGVKAPSLPTLQGFAAAFGLSIDDLVADPEPEGVAATP
jgi:transcriptional regulator with XRE-family HTH domain